MKPKVAVAISGGIDSLITASILKEKYKNIVGLHFITGYEPASFQTSELTDVLIEKNNPIVSISDLPVTHPITHIKNQLDIPIRLLDCRHYFQKTVVDYFVQRYRNGLTPNPCMICNPLIKFGVIFDIARQTGASYFATGHYARIIKKKDNLYLLQKGSDALKDQSYFLALLPKEVLPFVRFPLGTMTKQQVLEMAELKKLTPVSKKESQDVCFIQDNDYATFITNQDKISTSHGPITDLTGHQLGIHNGLHKFTIGQRRGINCPAGEPYYVLRIDIKQNRLIVGSKKDLYKSSLTIKNINWFIPKPESHLNVFVKIRYRHEAAEATLVPQKNNSVMIHFKKPQMAITPGQGAVCYVNNEVIAGGWIEK
ncbi:MAG: tRNA 2-thiouridine(34) synthase MnmA [Desulfobacteraceae bacterium]|nr:tRNA 2-thiouridine(34) synthase MnmA [Desulfobacteraceae bacterium]